MKLVSEKVFRDEIERRMREIEDKRWYCERMERLEKQLYEHEIRLDKLQARVDVENKDAMCRCSDADCDKREWTNSF